MPSLYNRVAGQSVERLAALSDGIFAVAMTLSRASRCELCEGADIGQVGRIKEEPGGPNTDKQGYKAEQDTDNS